MPELTVFYVRVPIVLTCYVEAEDKDDARARVAAAIVGKPAYTNAVWIHDVSPQTLMGEEWDVTHEDECNACGKPVGEYGHCCD